MIDYENFVVPKFNARNRAGGFITESLFLDTNPDTENYKPVYTFREHEVEFEGETLPSAYQVILHSVDEYDAAERLLGSYQHWKRLLKAPRIYSKGVANNPALTIQAALEDMQARLQREAHLTLVLEAQQGNVTAAKALSGANDSTPKKTPKKEDTAPSKPNLELFSNYKKSKGADS